MNSLVADSETTLRLLLFVTVFVLLAILERVRPRRQLTITRSRRWTANLGLSVLNTVVVRIAVPLAGVGAAVLAQERGWGLFNWTELPVWLEIVAFLLLFDLTIYLQHRLFHWQPLLWRMHRMHHTDPDYDLTTGNRFHPGSILISAAIKLGLVLLLGPVPVAIVLAEILLNATSMFNHSNVNLPLKLDKILRRIVVTPDMHRVHHSIEADEHNHNFGFNFPWWDHLFGTYQEQPRLPHADMVIGIRGFEANESANLLKLLVQPLRK